MLHYLGLSGGKIKYKESSWFRWTIGQSDVVFHNTLINTTHFSKPDIVWVQHKDLKTIIYFYLTLFTLLLSSLALIINLSFCRKRNIKEGENE